MSSEVFPFYVLGANRIGLQFVPEDMKRIELAITASGSRYAIVAESVL